jgi:hypothetical protein
VQEQTATKPDYVIQDDVLMAAAYFAMERCAPLQPEDVATLEPPARVFITVAVQPPVARLLALPEHGRFDEIARADGAAFPARLGTAVAAFIEAGLRRQGPEVVARVAEMPERLLVVIEPEREHIECRLIPDDGAWERGTTLFALTESLAQA